MATIYEVSELAGVSLATVSRVMNNSGRVSEKTRERVLAAMKELDYQPNQIAQSLASNRSNCVGVLVSEMKGPIFGSMLGAIEDELRKAGKFALFAAGHSDAEKEKEGIRFLASRKCDALILHVEALSSQFFIDKRDSLLPFVLINREAEGLQERCIMLDNEQGGYQATHHLLELGHRKIGYISGPLQWADALARLNGHKRALAEFDVQWDPRLLAEGDYLESSGSQCASELLNEEPGLTAMVCANDEMAAGAMEAIRAGDRSIPEDISIVGFDNVRWARFLYPKLTTINYPVTDMSRMAVQWVLKNVYGNPSLELKNVFQPELVNRASSIQCPGVEE